MSSNMNWFLLVTFLIACGWLWPIKGDDCVYKVCLCQGNLIMCSYRDLTTMPPISIIKPGLSRLILSNNNIQTIHAGSLPPSLTEISFLNNPITNIDNDAFDQTADTLRIVSFSSARFTRIPDAFRHLRTLASLTIYDTNIQDWNVEAMTIIGSTIETLVLENVGLSSWPVWIQSFINLKELSIVSSQISFLPDNALDMVGESLTSLTLIMSSLKSIPKTFSTLKNLQSLQVQNNQISNLTWLPRSQLTSLALDNNIISDAKQLSDSLFYIGETLTDLTLTNNQLSAIPDFSYLEKIESLDFSNNRISDPHSGSLPTKLYYLNLSYNSLRVIPTVFLNLPIVKVLLLTSNFISHIHGTYIPYWTLEAQLGYNTITELTETSFPANCEITSLNLMNNPLTTISNLAFQNLVHLTILNLQNTLISRLPLAISSLTSLSYLDVSSCPRLVCTCMEKSIAPVIIKPTIQIVGNCDIITVLMFFTKLSPSCPS